MARGAGKVRAASNSLVELRKVCNHPFLLLDEPPLDTDDWLVRSSGKFDLLDRILPKLKRTGHRVLMFTQFVRVMDIAEQYLRSRHHLHLRLDGSVRPACLFIHVFLRVSVSLSFCHSVSVILPLSFCLCHSVSVTLSLSLCVCVSLSLCSFPCYGHTRADSIPSPFSFCLCVCWCFQTCDSDREQRVAQFNAPDSPYFLFLLSTRAGGLGVNLPTADTVRVTGRNDCRHPAPGARHHATLTVFFGGAGCVSVCR